MSWNSFLWLKILVITALKSDGGNLAFNFPDEDDHTGTSCTVNYSFNRGVCTPLSECPSASEALHCYQLNPKICGSEDATPLIVCCANPTSGNVRYLRDYNLVPQRKSEKACYDMYVPKPVTLPDGYLLVVGGLLAEPDEFVHMAAIGWKGTNGKYEFRCGGTLISPIFVLSAAHCAKTRGNLPEVVRTGGIHLYDGLSTNIPIKKIHIHPSYVRRSVYNDIALLELATAVKDIPACLWQTDAIYTDELTAIGYGHTQFEGKGSDQLMKLNLTVFSNFYCSLYYSPDVRYSSGIVDTQICLGDQLGAKDTCQGDSGGPVETFFELNGIKVPFVVGITSFGHGCAAGEPSVYTRVSSYLDWIESIVWPDDV